MHSWLFLVKVLVAALINQLTQTFVDLAQQGNTEDFDQKAHRES